VQWASFSMGSCHGPTSSSKKYQAQSSCCCHCCSNQVVLCAKATRVQKQLQTHVLSRLQLHGPSFPHIDRSLQVPVHIKGLPCGTWGTCCCGPLLSGSSPGRRCDRKGWSLADTAASSTICTQTRPHALPLGACQNAGDPLRDYHQCDISVEMIQESDASR